MNSTIIVSFPGKKLRFSAKIQGFCKRPFPGYPDGCPNFGNRDTCPPKMPLIDKVMDLSKDVFVIATQYEVAAFVKKKGGQSTWFDRKWWNDLADAEHMIVVEDFLKEQKEKNGLDLLHLLCPEGAGVEIASLTEQANIILDWTWPPKKGVVWTVSLAGQKKL